MAASSAATPLPSPEWEEAVLHALMPHAESGEQRDAAVHLPGQSAYELLTLRSAAACQAFLEVRRATHSQERLATSRVKKLLRTGLAGLAEQLHEGSGIRGLGEVVVKPGLPGTVAVLIAAVAGHGN